MLIEVFGKIQYVYELNDSITVEGDKLYIFLKETSKDGKTLYEYLGSMLSTFEDKTTGFMSAFLNIASHYALSSELMEDLMKLKNELDANDRELFFEGKEAV